MSNLQEVSDLTRMNRKERRNFSKRVKLHVPGRNLPFSKKEHGTLANYYKLREEEIKQEQDEHAKTKETGSGDSK